MIVRATKEEFLSVISAFEKGLRLPEQRRNMVLFVFEDEECCKLQENHDFSLSIGLEVITKEDVVIREGQCKLLPTGIKWAAYWEFGYYLSILPRSGMSSDTPLRIPNAPGTVEPTYRGEICVPMYVESDWKHKFGGCKGWIKEGLGFVTWKGIRICHSNLCDGEYEVRIPAGTRVAQMTLQVNFMVWSLGLPFQGDLTPFAPVDVVFAVDKEIFDNWDRLVPSVRGVGGFGSTGTK